MSRFVGSGVALVTPFNASGIDLNTLDQLLDWHLEQGTDAIVVAGTTGEASTLTLEERTLLFEHTVKRVNGRIPVIAGTGSNNTQQAISLSKHAETCGVDGLLIVTPYYNKCTQRGLVEHYSSIAKAVNLPIILYNVPSRSGVNLLPRTVLELSHVENIVGIKEASADITQIMELFRMVPEDFNVYSGNDDHIFPLLALGAKGVISTVANLIPKSVHELVTTFVQGDLSSSKKIQHQINPLVKAIFSEVNPIPVKAGVKLLGFAVGDVRLPLTSAEASTIDAIRQELANLEGVL